MNYYGPGILTFICSGLYYKSFEIMQRLGSHKGLFNY